MWRPWGFPSGRWIGGLGQSVAAKWMQRVSVLRLANVCAWPRLSVNSHLNDHEASSVAITVTARP